MTLEDIYQCLKEAFDGDYTICRVLPSSGRDEVQTANFSHTSAAERKGTEIPLEISKKYLHCGGCNFCQGEQPDEDEDAS